MCMCCRTVIRSNHFIGPERNDPSAGVTAVSQTAARLLVHVPHRDFGGNGFGGRPDGSGVISIANFLPRLSNFWS